jgi:hypothetical protein
MINCRLGGRINSIALLDVMVIRWMLMLYGWDFMPPFQSARRN